MTPAEEVMDALRVPCLRRVTWFSGETITHLTVYLSCGHERVLAWPVGLSPQGFMKFLLAANIDCLECAP